MNRSFSTLLVFCAIGIIAGLFLGTLWLYVSRIAALVGLVTAFVILVRLLKKAAWMISASCTVRPVIATALIYSGLMLGLLIGSIPIVFPGTLLAVWAIAIGIADLIVLSVKADKHAEVLACFDR